jgi:hypothetical protein
MTKNKGGFAVLGAGLNGDRTPVFFERALQHCYYQLEELIKQISITPSKFRKALSKRKAQLQREAQYIESKLKDFK